MRDKQLCEYGVCAHIIRFNTNNVYNERRRKHRRYQKIIYIYIFICIRESNIERYKIGMCVCVLCVLYKNTNG